MSRKTRTDPDLTQPDLTLEDLMTQWPDTIPVFLRHKMLCVGCMITPFHTLYDACVEYQLDMADFVAELEAAIKNPKHPDRSTQDDGRL
jgi:hybrid cluster-associated redox disulfide protein